MLVVPRPVVPMQPSLVRAPFDRPSWIHETKYDGWRMLAYRDGHTVRLISRQGVDWTRPFRELASAIAKLPTSTPVLDGELCLFDAKLVSRFEWLRDRPTADVCTPPIFIAFDVLQVGRRDVRALPLHRRRPLLKEQLGTTELVLPAERLDAASAWTTVLARGYEGLVAKDPESTYRPGPTRSWMKVKVAERVRRGTWSKARR